MTRTVFFLLAIPALVASSPIDPSLNTVHGSNLNLGCQHGCLAAASAQHLNKNAALGSTTSPLLGGLVLAGTILATL